MNNREHPLYSTWKGMRERCLNPSHIRFHRYGGRGVAVCERWNDFWLFVDDMGPKPLGCTLERKENDRGYEPDNCVWATPAEQQRNSSRNVMVTVCGVVRCVDDWAKYLGVHRTTLRSRASARDGDYVAAIRSFLS